MPSQRLANPFAYDPSAAQPVPAGNPLSAAARTGGATTVPAGRPVSGFTNALAAGYGATLSKLLPFDFEGRADQQLAKNREGLVATNEDSTPATSPLAAAAAPASPASPQSPPSVKPNPLAADATPQQQAQPERADTSVPGISRVNQPGQAPLFTNAGASGASPSPLVAGVTQSPDVMGALQREGQIRKQISNETLPALDRANGGWKTTNDEIVRDMLANGNTRDRQNALSYMASREDAANRQADPLAAVQRQQVMAQTGLTQNQLAAGAQLQQLQQKYLAETDPTKQQAMADQLMALQGREPSNHFSTNVVHGTKTKDAMGTETATDPMSLTTDLRTGQTVTQRLGGQQPDSQPKTVSPEQVVSGYRFKGGDPNKQANWEKAQ